MPASLDARLRGHDDGAHGGRRGQDLRPLVIDLSSLWAGPLCGHLLQRAGCEVVKVESLARPDGARAGPPAFFDLLNAGKSCVALDFAGAQGRAQLRALLAAADIVIEASRPRALRQLGIDAGELLAENPSLTWIGISGYGRDGARENWIAYGDDAGVAAGLSRLMHDATGERLFCGDAIADPLAGLHAALAGWAAHRAGGGRIVSVALRDVAAHVAAFDAPASPRGARERAQAWSAVVAAAGIGAARPLARVPAGAARPLGSDTAAVLARLGIP